MTPLEEGLWNFYTATSAWKDKPASGRPAQVWYGWASDVHDMVLSKGGNTWGDLDDTYKSAWLGELKRRTQLAGMDPAATMRGIGDAESRRDVRNALQQINNNRGNLANAAIRQVRFSQYCINNKFAGQAGGSPSWLATRLIAECAKDLRNNPTLSDTMRITLHHHAGVWMALNNRGLSLHALAAVEPTRMGFRDALGSEEAGRANVNPADYILNFGQSIPANRRDRRQFWQGFPVSVVAVIDGSPTNNQGDPIAKDVLYTVRCARLDTGDRGNQEVFVAYNP